MNKEIDIVFGVVDQNPHLVIRHSLFDKLLSDKLKIALFASPQGGKRFTLLPGPDRPPPLHRRTPSGGARTALRPPHPAPPPSTTGSGRLFDKLLSDKFKITLFASTLLLTPMPNLCNFLRWTFLTEANLYIRKY